MENKKTVVLQEAIEFGGKTLTELEVRRSTIGDEEDAMQAAINNKKTGNNLTVEIFLLSRVTGVPYDRLRSMHAPDYTALRSALNELNGMESRTASENPMTRGMN